jgi:hypothetical protein
VFELSAPATFGPAAGQGAGREGPVFAGAGDGARAHAYLKALGACERALLGPGRKKCDKKWMSTGGPRDVGKMIVYRAAKHGKPLNPTPTPHPHPITPISPQACI